MNAAAANIIVRPLREAKLLFPRAIIQLEARQQQERANQLAAATNIIVQAE